MPHFSYRAKKGPNELLSGVIEAATKEEAVDRLSDQGLLPLSVEESRAPVRMKEREQERPRPAQTALPAGQTKNDHGPVGRIKSTDITVFSRQMASLLRAGVPILQAFGIISDQTENPRFKRFLRKAVDEIKDGKPFSSVFAQYPKLFPPIYIALIRIGEDSGSLPETLLRISDYRQSQEEIRSRILSAMAYPALMAVTGIGTVVFMITFVVPKLSALFTNMGENLPVPTRILISISGLFHEKWFLIVPTVFFFIAAFMVKYQGPFVKRTWSSLSLRIPGIRTFVVKSELARLSRTMHLLIKSGIPILKAIEITAPVLGNSVLRAEFERTESQLAGGGTLGKSLKESSHFPLFMTNLISVGEETGRLDEALEEIAGYYERETGAAIKVMTSLIEPMMILLMGLVVGFIVIAMMLPMFELSLAVK